MLDQARKFLARVVPWDPDGYVNIHWRFQGDKYDKPGWSGRAFKSLNQAINTIEYQLKQPSCLDIYVCMSAQKMALEKTSRRGKTYMAAVRSQENVLSMKSFYMDIDVKEGAYANTKEAFAAFKEFLDKTGLPKPTYMVLSGGGGFQVYWVLSEALTVARWTPLAYALGEAAKQNGLLADVQCTIDCARILRVPQTYNRKYEQARDVRLLEEFSVEYDYAISRLETPLSLYSVPVPTHANAVMDEALLPAIGHALKESGDDLGAGISDTELVSNIEDVAQACPFVSDALTHGGKTYSNPLWNLTTLIAAFCEDGRTQAHRMADQHPGYSAQSTDELFDRKDSDRHAKGLGWPHCATIRGSGATQCTTCPHFVANKTPFHHIAPRIQNTVLVPPLSILPEGYSQGNDGRLYKTTIEDDGTTKSLPVCNYGFKDVWVQPDPWTLHFTYTQGIGEAKVAFPFDAASDLGQTKKLLFRDGMIMSEDAAKAVRIMLMAWTEKLRASRDVTRESAAFGWVTERGKLFGFAYGGTVYSKTEEIASAAPPTGLARAYTPVGDIQPWYDALKVITDQKRPALEAIIATSFAAPLFRFTGQPGVIVSAYSHESGIGKTTSMKVAQAAWGSPVHAMMTLDDTQTSVISKLGAIRSLPVFYDELKTVTDSSKFLNTVFKLSSGRDRARMTADLRHRDTGEWQTILALASNESLLDYASRNSSSSEEASINRIFEFVVEPGTQAIGSTVAVSRAVAKLNDNFGWAGVKYAQWIGANYDKANELVMAIANRLEKECTLTQDERFWSAAMASLLAGATLANKILDAKLDVVAMKAFLIKTLESLRDIKKEDAPALASEDLLTDLLARFFSEMRAKHTLTTDVAVLTPGRNHKSPRIINDASKLDTLYVQRATETGVVLIVKKSLDDWLVDNKRPPKSVLQALEKDYGLRRGKFRLGAGTPYSSGQQNALRLDLTHPKLKGLCDG